MILDLAKYWYFGWTFHELSTEEQSNTLGRIRYVPLFPDITRKQWIQQQQYNKTANLFCAICIICLWAIVLKSPKKANFLWCTYMMCLVILPFYKENTFAFPSNFAISATVKLLVQWKIVQYSCERLHDLNRQQTCTLSKSFQ